MMLMVPAFGMAQDDRIEKIYEDFNRRVEERYAAFNEKVKALPHHFEEEMSVQWVAFPEFETPSPLRDPDPFAEWNEEWWSEEGKRIVPTGSPALPEPFVVEAVPDVPDVPDAPIMPPAPVQPPASSLPPAGSSLDREMVTITPLFLQTPLSCQSTRPRRDASIETLAPADIAKFYAEFEEDVPPLAAFCTNYIQKTQLCDWAVFQFAKSVAVQLFPSKRNEQAVAAVCLLNRLGYKARVGRSGDETVCMLPICGMVYGASYYSIDGMKYYGFSMDANSSCVRNCSTYASDYPGATKSFDLNIYRPMRLDYSPADRTFVSAFRGDTAEIQVNANLIDLYANYPWTTLDVYANAQPDPRWVSEMEKVLEPMLRGKSEREQVGTILSYVQRSFHYATDQDQFGKEKYFFCEENYYYPSNDCEDHAILFSFLVRHFLSLDVVLLDYPNHVAAAVCFTDPEAEGDAVTYNGRRYIVCDPTYFGAGIGRTMPGYEDKSVEIVELKEI